MTITNKQAEYLLKLPKKIVEEDRLLLEVTIDQTFPPFFKRFELISESDDTFSFLWEIKQNGKKTIWTSLHFQENDSKIGLLRVDYYSRHKNPDKINEFVPKKFHPYVVKQFSIEEHHVHYNVQGYKTLEWAIPLKDNELGIKTIDDDDLNIGFKNVIKSFAKAINIETVIVINTLLTYE